MASGPFYEVGLHVGEITSQAVTKASTGTKQFVIGVKILGAVNVKGEMVAHRQQYNRSIFWAVTEKTVPFVIEKLNTLEFEGTAASQFDPHHPHHVSMVGRQVDLWCRHEQRQSGEWGEKWDVSTGGGGREYEELPAKEMRELDALFGKALTGAKKAQQPASYQPGSAEADLGITDDDIPF